MLKHLASQEFNGTKKLYDWGNDTKHNPKNFLRLDSFEFFCF